MKNLYARRAILVFALSFISCSTALSMNEQQLEEVLARSETFAQMLEKCIPACADDMRALHKRGVKIDPYKFNRHMEKCMTLCVRNEQAMLKEQLNKKN